MDDDGNLVVVADGTCHPIGSSIIHTMRLLPNHYKVSIDKPYEEYLLVDLPVPTPDGETKFGKAKGYFVNWPMSFVLFEDAGNEQRITSQCKEGVGSCDPLRTQQCDHTDGEEHEPATLVEYELLRMLMEDDNHESIRVSFKAPMLYLKEDQETWVTSTDIDELIRGVCINVSVIQVYIRFLVEEFKSSSKGENITFLCPHRISAAECKSSFFDVVAYVKHAFNSEANKKDSKSRIILVPYNEDNHWILMAIHLSGGVIYQFDPLIQKAARQLSCDNVFDLAYKSYRARMKEVTKPVMNVARVQCVQQTGGLECGYYIMKYMHEIVSQVTLWNDDVEQIKDIMAKSGSYSKRELDEVREEWARFFRLNFLLS